MRSCCNCYRKFISLLAQDPAARHLVCCPSAGSKARLHCVLQRLFPFQGMRNCFTAGDLLDPGTRKLWRALMTLLVPIAVGWRAHLFVGLATNMRLVAGSLPAIPRQRYYVHGDKVRPVAAVGRAQGHWTHPIRGTLQADHGCLNSARGPNMRASCNHPVSHTTINVHTQWHGRSL